MSALLLMSLLLSPAVDPIQAATLAGDVDQMIERAEAHLKLQPEDAQAHAALALGRWFSWSRAAWLWADRWAKQQQRSSRRARRNQRLLRGLMREIPEANRLVEGAFRATLNAFAQDLETVETHLKAADKPGFSLLVQPAAFAFDVDMNGQLDPGERGLFEVVRAADGALIPEGDPRRRPVFRLDQGDVKWALAYISFQRAAVEVAHAYDIAGSQFWANRGRYMRFALKEPARIKDNALPLLKAGLAYSRAAREAYLAEADDDREWLPNPSQTNQGIPLPIDAALYETWAQALMGVEALLNGAAVLDLDEIFTRATALLGEADPEMLTLLKPTGNKQQLDVRALLMNPSDIELDLAATRDAASLAPLVEQIFSGSLVQRRPASSLPALIFKAAAASHGQRAQGAEGVKRAMLFKARYLVWIN